MEFKQVYTPGLAHCSYVIGGKNECVVVDPSRSVDRYVQIAENFNLPITAIIETHLHADFISGHMELAKRTGAQIYISAQAKANFAHYAVKDGEEFRIDTLLFKMLDTPGHTPEASVFVVSDLERGEIPALVFSGDTLLIGDAGRPDLFPDIKNELAAKLYHSLLRIKEIGDHVEVYPAHGAGSLCGKVLSSKLSSTIGTERMYNAAMKIHPEDLFIRTFLAEMPEAPDHFSRCSEINRKGPALLADLPRPKPLSPGKFLKEIAAGAIVVDTRDQLAFASAHIPKAYGLSIKGNFATFSGWVLPPDKPLLLVMESDDDLKNILPALYSVGLDNVIGYLHNGMTTWAEEGLRTSYLKSISILELKDLWDKNEVELIDTRLKSEYDVMHIDGSIHCPAPDVRHRYHEFIGDKPVAFICNTGNRSLLAASLMLNLSGSSNVINVIGGTSAWQKAGCPLG
ncbi:MAG TPA: rhodanese-like domain-containing protein [Syntrophomonas sp.]|nr:rhodanese-like domain-containing protein [Syntrophomonas sp.]HRW12375.1 rhodanese-like domain-containing protein [Syntrophomonas sp.]